jgi:hypothetical protein
MRTLIGQDVVATIAAPADVADLGARIEAPTTRAIVSYWRPASYDPDTGLWTVRLLPPVVSGDYDLVWRTGDREPPEFETFEPLTVALTPGWPRLAG